MRLSTRFAGVLVIAIAALSAAALRSAPVDPVISMKARTMEQGELIVVTIKTTTAAERVMVSAFGRETKAFRDQDPLTWRALIGIDLDQKPDKYTVKIEVSSGSGKSAGFDQSVTVLPHAFPTRTLTVDDAYVNPPAEVTERIAREAEELAKLWTESSPERLWSGTFERPVPQESNSAFGSRSVFNGQARSPHSGADFLSPAGTPIHAPNAGRVMLARDLYFSGNTVIIDHGLGLFSQFAHMSKIGVEPGQTVTSGQVVGEVGATGRVTGAHLHWAVRLTGARIDPLSLLATLGGTPQASSSNCVTIGRPKPGVTYTMQHVESTGRTTQYTNTWESVTETGSRVRITGSAGPMVQVNEHHITDDAMVLDRSTKLNSNGGTIDSTTYRPGIIGDPAFRACPGKVWTISPVTATYQSSTNRASMATPAGSLRIIAIRERITVPAGTFDTVHYIRTSQSTDEYWKSLDAGVVVKHIARVGGNTVTETLISIK